MMKLNNIIGLFCFALALVSCAKEEVETPAVVRDAMLFGVEQIAQTKVAYGEQDNGGISATFDIGDNVGVYAFYNNFFYWYPNYSNFAESVIFANQGMWVTEDGAGSQNLSYTPLKSWTFSTIYGDAPHTLDVVATYPLIQDKPEQLQMLNTTTGYYATLEYYYAYQQSTTTDDETTTEIVVNCHNDFMTAHTRYDENEDNPSDFRTQMLELDGIPLKFTRQTAVMNIQVTKPANYEAEIKVNGVTVEFDAPLKFTQKIKPYTTSANENVEWDNTSMASLTDGFGDWLTATATFSTPKTLAPTEVTDTPDDDYQYIIGRLFDLTTDKDQLLYFPPGTDINKITFDITVDGEDKTYEWHPHIAEIEANTTFIITLELDPDRKS